MLKSEIFEVKSITILQDGRIFLTGNKTRDEIIFYIFDLKNNIIFKPNFQTKEKVDIIEVDNNIIAIYDDKDIILVNVKEKFEIIQKLKKVKIC